MPSTPSSRSRRVALTAALLVALAVGVIAYIVGTRDTTPPGPDVVSTETRTGAAETPLDHDVAVPGIAEPGDPAPPLDGATLHGDAVMLSDFAGKPLIINFWASWCFPCRAEFPLLAEVHEEGEVAVIGVVFNDLASDAQAFVEEMGATWDQVRDDDGNIARDYGVRSIPRTIFVGSDGIIRASVYGFTEESFRREVATLE